LAIARRPIVLVADEPYRGIAPADHEDLTNLFRSLAADGCAVVVSGHEVPSLFAAADHVTWCTVNALCRGDMSRNDVVLIFPLLLGACRQK